ncbi:hypothetical protein [Paraburkholderia sp. CI3]|uniref:hypothetical protein n=1 Tax=Paraburkholderia sp. CI3 TaxID=2991060 RepID=UPI003D1BA666
MYPFRNPDALGRYGEDMTFSPQGPTAYQGYELSYYCHADSLSAFPVNGVPSMAHFTDYFRFIMFTKTDEIWADTDIFSPKTI